MGDLKKKIYSDEIDENDLSNVDETHFLFNMDSGRTLNFTAERYIQYTDVFSAGDGMNMLLRLNGGTDARIVPAFIIFTNK